MKGITMYVQPKPKRARRTKAETNADPIVRKTVALRRSEWRAIEEYAWNRDLAITSVTRAAYRALGIPGIVVSDR